MLPNFNTDGRRPIYLASLPFLCLGSLGVGLSHSVPSLIFFRTIQGFGAASGLSVGPAVVADIYKMEERGAAMGVFFSVRFVPYSVVDSEAN